MPTELVIGHRVRCTACGRWVLFARDVDGKIKCLDSIAPVWIARERGDDLHCHRNTAAFVGHHVTCPKRELFKAPT